MIRRVSPTRTECPVCRRPCRLTKDNRIGVHQDGVGKECIMVRRRQGVWEERNTTEAVRGRSGGICEYCLRQRATDRHHRKSRGVGGEWSPANIIHLCSVDHRAVTENPDWAWGLGLIVKSHEDPGLKPVTREDGTQFQPTNEVTP